MRTVISGVNDADSSVLVLERSLAEARSTNRPLEVVNAWSMPMVTSGMTGLAYGGLSFSTDDISISAKAVAEELLQKALASSRDHRQVPTSSAAVAGDAGRVLVERGKDAGLVVVGGRRHGAVLSVLLGSTTSYVLHHAISPVMIVPGTTAPGPFLRVIAGVDGEGCSRSALRWALDAAARHHCPLTVVHANNILGMPWPNTTYPDYDAIALSWLRKEVADVLTDTGDVQVRSEVLPGPAARVLLEVAGPDDLLVVGSRGRGGFQDLVLGSVATQCATHARGTVVVVREDQERLPSSDR